MNARLLLLAVAVAAAVALLAELIISEAKDHALVC
jgi:hypothetical protein